ncbi:MAG: carbon-nitrogen hydrolase family protein [Candidatus Hydrogenedentota bacterium]
MAMLRVCGVQMQVQQAKKDNLPKILEHIKNYQGDFILFPEMALTGCNNEFSDSRTAAAWDQLAAACRQAYLTAIVGTGARVDGKSYIQARVFGDDGEVVGTYEKILPTQQERAWCRPGDELRVWDYKGIRFGCLIGNDFWVTPGAGPFPDPRLTHQLGQKGARVIFHLVNSGSDQLYLPYHEANLRLRAIESGCYIVTTNAAPADGPVNCPSGVMSPEGEWLVQCPRDGEHRFCFDIELDLDLD